MTSKSSSTVKQSVFDAEAKSALKELNKAGVLATQTNPFIAFLNKAGVVRATQTNPFMLFREEFREKDEEHYCVRIGSEDAFPKKCPANCTEECFYIKNRSSMRGHGDSIPVAMKDLVERLKGQLNDHRNVVRRKFNQSGNNDKGKRRKVHWRSR